jgi:acyl-CoA thioesterase-1
MMKKTIYITFTIVALVLGYRFFFSSPTVTNSYPAGETIICFGDSLTYGTGTKKGMDYPSQLSGMISHEVINAGVPGDTTQSALERLEEDVLSNDPRIVLITLGGNDILGMVSKETAFQNFKSIIEKIHSKGALVVIGGIDIPLRGRNFGSMYEKLEKETGIVLIPNIFKGIMGHRSLMSDYIHPNDSGYTKMSKMFYDAMEPYL